MRIRLFCCALFAVIVFGLACRCPRDFQAIPTPEDNPCPTCQCFPDSGFLAAKVSGAQVTEKGVLAKCNSCKFPVSGLVITFKDGTAKSVTVLDDGCPTVNNVAQRGMPGCIVDSDWVKNPCASIEWINADGKRFKGPINNGSPL